MRALISPAIRDMAGKRYALLIGNTYKGNKDFSDNKTGEGLKRPPYDVECLQKILETPNPGYFDEVIPLKDGSHTEIRETIEEFFHKKDKDDVLLLYFSGHGVRGSKKKLYLAAQDTQEGLLRSTAINAQFLKEQVDDSYSKKKIIILDCCYSGTFHDIGKKGNDRDFKEDIEELFEGSCDGTIILTSTKGTETTNENSGGGLTCATSGSQSKCSHSPFTYFLIQGIVTWDADLNGNGKVGIKELFEYAAKNLKDIPDHPNPSMSDYNLVIEEESDILIAINPEAIIPDSIESLLKSDERGEKLEGISALCDWTLNPSFKFRLHIAQKRLSEQIKIEKDPYVKRTAESFLDELSKNSEKEETESNRQESGKDESGASQEDSPKGSSPRAQRDNNPHKFSQFIEAFLNFLRKPVVIIALLFLIFMIGVTAYRGLEYKFIQDITSDLSVANDLKEIEKLCGYLTGEIRPPFLLKAITYPGGKEQCVIRKHLVTLGQIRNEYEQKPIFDILIGLKPDPDLGETIYGGRKPALDWLAGQLLVRLDTTMDIEEAEQLYDYLLGRTTHPLSPFPLEPDREMTRKAQEAYDAFWLRKEREIVRSRLEELEDTSDLQRAYEIFMILIGERVEPSLKRVLSKRIVKEFEQQANALYAGVISKNVPVILPLDKDGNIDWPYPVKVIEEGTRLYPDISSNRPLSERLSFNATVKILRQDMNRILVQGTGSTDIEPKGWVDIQNLLIKKPFAQKGLGNLDLKFYRRMDPVLRGEFGKMGLTFYSRMESVRKGDSETSLRVCPSSESLKDSDQCQELPDFTGAFVFAEKNGRYLLGEADYLDEATSLLGWVDNDDGVLWKTSMGIRPQESLAFPQNHPLAGEERVVCAYLNDTEASTRKNCLPILGGERWFQTSQRMPVLEMIDIQGQPYYKVLLSLPGIGVTKTRQPSTIGLSPRIFTNIAGFDPTQFYANSPIDIFFLIDGTKSMQPYIKSASEVANRVINAFDDAAFKNVPFRFGFRIYRDAYARKLELGEGLPMASVCEWNRDLQQRNLEEFQQKLGEILATEEKNDDYEENLLGGIQQAIADISSCSDNTKILFIIGDSGYSAEAQERKGRPRLDAATLGDTLRDKQILTFFLQPPKTCGNADQEPCRQAYNDAYNLFQEQALLILQQLGYTEAERKNYVMTTNDENLDAAVIEGIKRFEDDGSIGPIDLPLEGGTTLVQVIEYLQQVNSEINLPGLFWDVSEDDTCDSFLGELCARRVYDTASEAYIPASDDIVEDIWIKEKDLETWVKLVKILLIEEPQTFSSSELRVQFVENIKRAVGLPNSYTYGERPLYDVLISDIGLPARQNSPLLKYSLNDLENQSVVTDCELDRLVMWVSNVSQMLNILGRGDMRPEYTIEPFPGECPYGEDIPYIPGEIRAVPLGSNENIQEIPRYDHKFQKVHAYWIPSEYML